MKSPITTLVICSDAGFPLKVSACCGLVIMRFPYEESMSIASNHRNAAQKLAIALGFTETDAKRLVMVRTSTGFAHESPPRQLPKSGFGAFEINK